MEDRRRRRVREFLQRLRETLSQYRVSLSPVQAFRAPAERLLQSPRRRPGTQASLDSRKPQGTDEAQPRRQPNLSRLCGWKAEAETGLEPASAMRRKRQAARY